MNTLYEAKVHPKAYRSFYLLNKNTSIRVKTGTGTTESADVSEIIGQGSGGAALVSLDKGIDEMFSGSSDEMMYGSIRVQPMIFQDDILRLGDGLPSVKAGNVKVSSVMNQKRLTLNADKTGYIIVGDETKRKRTQILIKRSPIICGDFEVKEKIQDKYLGDVLHQGGCAASVLATVMDREGKVKAAMLEAAAIVDDFRAQCVGGFMVAIDLWELAIIPTLLNNAGTWTNIDEKTEDRLEELQLFFVRLVLQVPVSTPKVALRSETGLCSMKHRVEKEKVMLIHHIKSLSQRTLARQVYNQQVENNWPGLAAETRTICERLGLEDVNKTESTKNQYKNEVMKACRREDEILLRSKMEGRSKVQDLVTESCQLKEYFHKKSLSRTRDMFRIRTHMNGLKANFKHDKKVWSGRREQLPCDGVLQVRRP